MTMTGLGLPGLGDKERVDALLRLIDGQLSICARPTKLNSRSISVSVLSSCWVATTYKRTPTWSDRLAGLG